MEKLTKTKLKTAIARSLVKPREWTYWDGITIEVPKDDMYVLDKIDAEAKTRLIQDNCGSL